MPTIHPEANERGRRRSKGLARVLAGGSVTRRFEGVEGTHLVAKPLDIEFGQLLAVGQVSNPCNEGRGAGQQTVGLLGKLWVLQPSWRLIGKEKGLVQRYSTRSAVALYSTRPSAMRALSHKMTPPRSEGERRRSCSSGL